MQTLFEVAKQKNNGVQKRCVSHNTRPKRAHVTLHSADWTCDGPSRCILKNCVLDRAVVAEQHHFRPNNAQLQNGSHTPQQRTPAKNLAESNIKSATVLDITATSSKARGPFRSARVNCGKIDASGGSSKARSTSASLILDKKNYFMSEKRIQKKGFIVSVHPSH